MTKKKKVKDIFNWKERPVKRFGQNRSDHTDLYRRVLENKINEDAAMDELSDMVLPQHGENREEIKRQMIEEPHTIPFSRHKHMERRRGGIPRYEDGGIVTDQEPEVQEKDPKYRLKGTTKLEFKPTKKEDKFEKLMKMLEDDE